MQDIREEFENKIANHGFLVFKKNLVDINDKMIRQQLLWEGKVSLMCV